MTTKASDYWLRLLDPKPNVSIPLRKRWLSFSLFMPCADDGMLAAKLRVWRCVQGAKLSRRRRMATGHTTDRKGGPKVRAIKSTENTAASGKTEEGVSLKSVLEERIAWIEQHYVIGSTVEEPGKLGRMFKEAGTDAGSTWQFLHTANPIAVGTPLPSRHVPRENTCVVVIMRMLLLGGVRCLW